MPSSKKQSNRQPAAFQTKREPAELQLSEASSENEQDTTASSPTKSQGQKSQGTRKAAALQNSRNNGRTSKPKAKPKQNRKNEEDEEDYDADNDGNRTQNAGISTNSMVSNCLLYMLIANTKQHPIKRADISKHALKGVKLNPLRYKEMLKKVQLELKSVFGIEMYGLNESTYDIGHDLSIVGFNSFILVSDFKPIINTAKIVELTSYEETVRTVLFMSLSILFMNSIDPTVGMKEETLWRAISKLQLDIQLGITRQQDFTKFLKTELVQKLYLFAQETRDEGQEVAPVKYFWGPRAHLEYSKLDILLHVASYLNEKPESFPEQYKMILDSDEKHRALYMFDKLAQTQGDDTDEETNHAGQGVPTPRPGPSRHPASTTVTGQATTDSSEIDTQDLSSLTPELSDLLGSILSEGSSRLVNSSNNTAEGVIMDTSEIDTQEVSQTPAAGGADDGSDTDFSY